MQKLNEVLGKIDEGNRWAATANYPVSLLTREGSDPLHRAPQPQELEQDSPAFDGSQVPSSFSSTDSVLAWAIFRDRFPRGYLTDELFIADHISLQWAGDGRDLGPLGLQSRGICEEEVPELVDRFLRFVHIKNPILETKLLREDARRFAENGFDWDARSCTVVRRTFPAVTRMAHSCLAL